MCKYLFTLFYLCCFQPGSHAQPVHEKMMDNPGPFYKGYALRGEHGKDTLACSIAFDSKLEVLTIPDMAGKVFLLMDSIVFRVVPEDLNIIGFGFEAKGKQHDYGLFFAYSQFPQKNIGYFLKKMVPGTIDLYKFEQVEKIYSTWGTEAQKQTKRTTPNANPSNKGGYGLKTRYVIGKTDNTREEYVNPIMLPSMRKQYVASFFEDYPELLAMIPEKFSIRKLKRYVKDYNFWRRQREVR